MSYLIRATRSALEGIHYVTDAILTKKKAFLEYTSRPREAKVFKTDEEAEELIDAILDCDDYDGCYFESVDRDNEIKYEIDIALN